MMEIINFIFRSFWHFIGTIVLISATANGVAQVIRAINPWKKDYKCDCEKEEEGEEK